MLRALRRAWKNYLASIPKSEVVNSIPPSQWDASENLPSVSNAKRKAFLDLLSAVYSHLSPGERNTLVASGAEYLTRGDDIDTALHSALVGDDDSRAEARHPRGFITCDWKGADELHWQADALRRAHGLTDDWESKNLELDEALENLGMWLREHQLHLFSFSTGDNIVAFAVQEAQSASVRKNLGKLRIRFSVAGEA